MFNIANTIRTHGRTVKWNLFFNYTTIVYNVFTGFVLIPLYLRFISSELYGAWLATGNIIAWMSVVDPGFSDIIRQKVSVLYGQKNMHGVGSYVTNALVFSFILSFLVLIIGLTISVFFTSWLKFESLDVELLKKSFQIAVVGTSLMIFSYNFMALNQGLQSSLGTGMINTVVNISGLILTIVLLYKGYGLLSIPLTLVWQGLGFSLGAIFYLSLRIKIEKIKINFNLVHLKECLSLGSYTFLARMSSIVHSQINLFLVGRYIGIERVPTLKFTQAAPEISSMLLIRPALSVAPILGQIHGEGNKQELNQIIIRFFNYLVWGIGLCITGFLLLNEAFISLWVGIEFYGGDRLNIYIITLISLTIISQSISKIVFAIGQIKSSSIILVIQVVIFLVIVLIWGIKNGLEGIVLSGIMSNLMLPFWYFPKLLFNQVSISTNQIQAILLEIMSIALVSTGIIFTMSKTIAVTGWATFALKASAVTLLYILLMYMVSNPFKKELMYWINKAATRIK